MNTLDFIKMGLEASRNLTLGLLDDMQDAPLTQPTSKGGNHPLWILGHLTYSEANLVNHVILGNENPLIDWKEMFGSEREPVIDANSYLPWDQVRQTFDEVRAQTMQVLDGFSDDDLDLPSKNCPPGREQFLGTVAGCLLVLMLHPTMHRGQVADARRMADRKPLFA
ncbi:DinB superfamily protein [Gimesia alba]|uniref:DinB superfamily protein n=1 Tax=Gimesia alba TaxID=2527973 RepID=A0A517RDI0_9PLAN|nr:DinB family protein [Gimesia alba]QDT41929.1 DinB superfamily protein [Gimesia alba]